MIAPSKTRMSGREYNAFQKWSGWRDGDLYWEDTLFTINGEETDDLAENQPEGAVIEILGGAVRSMTDQEFSMTAIDFSRKFLRSLTTKTILVEIQRMDEQEFREGLRGMGRRVRVLK